MIALTVLAVVAFSVAPASAQYYGQYSANPFAGPQVNPYQSYGNNLYDRQGSFAGNTNNQFDQNSVNNQFGRYGNQFSPDSMSNPFGRYGNQFSPDAPSNPFGQGFSVCGPYGCQ